MRLYAKIIRLNSNVIIMITWKATIKERGNEHILTPTYSMPDDMFGYVKDEQQREYETRKFLIGFWGLENPDIEWYKLEKINKHEE